MKCELKPESAEKHQAVKGWCSPFPPSVHRMRKLRSVILDALEASDDVKSIEVTAGGDGRAQFAVSVTYDKDNDPRGGRYYLMDPTPFATLTFDDDEDQKW